MGRLAPVNSIQYTEFPPRFLFPLRRGETDPTWSIRIGLTNQEDAYRIRGTCGRIIVIRRPSAHRPVGIDRLRSVPRTVQWSRRWLSAQQARRPFENHL